MDNDEALYNALSSNKAVLFIGAGALATSQLANGNFSPIGNSLSKVVFEHFFTNEEYEGESLQQVSSIVQASHGKQRLHEFLNSFFKGIKPSKGIKKLTEFNWSRIYTTNLDRAIERAYQNSPKKAKKLVPVVGPNDVGATSPETEVTLYKLHGCISRPGVELVFSLEEYANYKESHLKLFNQLSIDLVDKPIIFIGYSTVDSNFQQTLASVKKYCDTTKKKYNYFFVGPSIKPSLSVFLKSNGFISYDMGIDEFAKHISALTSGHRTTLRDFYIENTLNTELFSKGDLDGETTYSLSKDYYFPNIELNKSVSKNTNFYKGGYPSWGDIKYNLDAQRNILEELLFSFENWYANPRFNIWIVRGRAGDGKSTVLKRFASEVAARIGDHVLFAKSRSSLDPDKLEKLQSSINQPLVIFIDNMTDRLLKVNKLIERFRRNKINILLIGASRNSDWFSSLNNFFTKPIDFEIKKLSEEEILAILDRLEFHDSLHALEDKTHEQRFEIFNERSERELIVAMCESTSGLSLEEIIANEYTSLRSQLAKSSYKHICLIHQFRYRIPQSLFLRVMDLDFETVNENVFDLTQDVIYIDEADGTDYLLRSRHSVIASIISKYYFKDEVKKVEFLKDLFKDHVPSNPLEASLIKMLYHHTTIKEMFDNIEIGVKCYNHLATHVPDDPYLLQQKALFLAYYTNDYPAAKETIREAIRLNETSGVLRHTYGTILMKEALQENDEDKSIYYLEEGKRILTRGLRKNSDNVYNYHTLISSLIKWYKQKGKGKENDNLILEIQELVHEASQNHPNDSMILTEHGKLHKLLHHSEESKSYFEKAIELNPGNVSARYLLAKIFMEEDELEEAYQITNKGVKIKPGEVQINRLKFELMHALDNMGPEEIIREYENYLHVNKKDSFLKLCYAAYLYSIGNRKCDRVFNQLRNSEIMSFNDKFRVSPELYRIINQEVEESGTIISVRAKNYFLKTDRFDCNTHCFLSKNTIQGLNQGDQVQYKVRYNYLSPFAIDVKKV